MKNYEVKPLGKLPVPGPFLVKLAVIVVGVVGFVFTLYTTQTYVTVQRGYSGTGMEAVIPKAKLEAAYDSSQAMPPPLPQLPAEGLKAGEAYENVQVLGNLTTGQFTRLMTHITQWVAPEQGCNYCHYSENLASDGKYTKVVSRRMIQMTQHINENWSSHVQGAGVNCWTCHRGNNVPEYIWFKQPQHRTARVRGGLGNPAGQNKPDWDVGLASLPGDPFTPFLEEENGIRVIGPTPLPTGNMHSIKQAEWTYGLMMHMSNSLGVNCTYCHNSRAMAMWTQSPPARSRAWYGIRMVRELNQEYLHPLQGVYPEYRLGPTGDAPKANCATCHQGVYKPMLGKNMVEDYPSLRQYVAYVPPPPPEPEEASEDEGEDADADGEEGEEGDDPSDADPSDGEDDAEPVDDADSPESPTREG